MLYGVCLWKLRVVSLGNVVITLCYGAGLLLSCRDYRCACSYHQVQLIVVTSKHFVGPAIKLRSLPRGNEKSRQVKFHFALKRRGWRSGCHC